jgi:hypothetical protein
VCRDGHRDERHDHDHDRKRDDDDRNHDFDDEYHLIAEDAQMPVPLTGVVLAIAAVGAVCLAVTARQGAGAVASRASAPTQT